MHSTTFSITLPYLSPIDYSDHKTLTAVKKTIDLLESHLASSKSGFIVGDNFTFADISVFSRIYIIFRLTFDEKIRSKYPSISKWYTKIANIPEVASEYIGSSELYAGPSNEIFVKFF